MLPIIDLSMASSSLLYFILILLSTQISYAIPHISTQISYAIPHISKLTTSQLQFETPTTYFEVTKPIKTPLSEPCSTLILQHNFSYTYSKPPITTPYLPPQCLSQYQTPPSLAILDFSATCQGRQFDRIFGIWLSGIEILRSCTAEPLPNGISWNVKKDVTKYNSLFMQPQTLVMYLGNIIDSTYTGIYHVNVSLHFWFDDGYNIKTADLADMILPVSRNLPLNEGLWFEVQNSTDIQFGEVVIPRNAYKAVLEVYVSFHQNDESWYSNPPSEYIEKNDIQDMPGNGAFREVVVTIDGNVVGCIWPFTVIFTGGVIPLLWRPITAIGSFDLPSYDIEITPFLGKILDGKKHRFGFGVTDALDVWFVDANLHLWLDSKSDEIIGELVRYAVLDFNPVLNSDFTGLDGKFDTMATREISLTGWVNSSHGNVTTYFFQTFNFTNLMEFKGNGSIQIVNQTIDFNYGTKTKLPASHLYSEQIFQNFPLYLYTDTSDKVNDSYTVVSDVLLGFNKKKISRDRSGFSFSLLKNSQSGQGIMHVRGHLVTSGLGENQQVYRYDSSDDCYFRNVSSSNYTILYDESGDSCTKHLGFIMKKCVHSIT